jgi:hypothetical protein
MPKEINSVSTGSYVEGKDISMEKMREMPEFSKNQKIWEEIKNGIFNNIKKLTLLNPEIAEDLSYEEYIYLDGLVHISDGCAEKFRNHKGNLSLNGLVALSDKSAEHLSSQKGFLYLSSLTSISDKGIKYLTRHSGEVSTNAEIKKRMDNFKNK